VGITYLLTDDRKTVLRIGLGVSYVEGGQLYKTLPFFYSQVIATDQNSAPLQLLGKGLPIPVFRAESVDCGRWGPGAQTAVLQYQFKT
jgi:hypothetical protein